MTSNEEINLVLQHVKQTGSWPEGKGKEWLIAAYLETPSRRAVLATSCITPFRSRLNYIIATKHEWGTPGYTWNLTDTINHMLHIKSALDGREKFDRVAFLSLLGDLRATQDELDQTRTLSNKVKQSPKLSRSAAV